MNLLRALVFSFLFVFTVSAVEAKDAKINPPDLNLFVENPKYSDQKVPAKEKKLRLKKLPQKRLRLKKLPPKKLQPKKPQRMMMRKRPSNLYSTSHESRPCAGFLHSVPGVKIIWTCSVTNPNRAELAA